MKKKNRTVPFISLTLIFSGFLLLPSFLFGQVYDNIGFKKDVPEEIRKACPMCDEFLDVKWIDEKRYIGKLKTEWYKDGEKQGTLYLLVKLEEPGSDDIFRRGNFIIYDITEQEYRGKDFEKFIKQAKYTYGKGYFFMFARQGNIKRDLSQGKIPSEFYLESYANFSKTLCILYPNEKYIFIAETKKPFMEKYLNEKAKQKYDQIIEYVNEKCPNRNKCIMDQIKYSDAIDINFDGLNGFIFRFWVEDKRKVLILFSKNNRHEFRDISDCIPHIPVFYVTKDKKGVYFGKCNLTELTKGGN